MTLEEYENSEKTYESYKDELGIVMMPDKKVEAIEKEYGVTLIKESIPGGISAVVSVILENGDSFYHVPIHTAIIEDYRLDMMDVVEMATKQMAERFPYKFVEAYKEIGVVPMNKENEGMYVLEAEKGPFGTSSIMYEGVLDHIADRIGGDFYIVPSSTDWFTIFDADGLHNIDFIKRLMVMHTIELGEEFFLSDNVLFYDSSKGKILLADEKSNSKVLYFNRTSEYDM